jgi:hypothetical protein
MMRRFYPSSSQFLRHQHGTAGFSIIEIIITISILLTMTTAVTTMLRSGFEVRSGLSQKAKVSHRLNLAMSMIIKDIEHGLVISPNDQVRMPSERSVKTLFKIDQTSDVDKLSLTAISHKPFMANAHVGDQVYVVYEVRDASDSPGRKHLYRGEINVAASDLREDPPMRIVARHIKKFKVTAWRGDEWLRDRWDSSRSETRGKMPRLVRVELSSWNQDPFPGEAADPAWDEDVSSLVTVVQPPLALGFADLKQPMSSIKIW